MSRWSHAYTVAFEVETDIEDGHEVPAEVLLAALKKRVAYLESNPSEIPEACGEPFDSFDMEEE